VRERHERDREHLIAARVGGKEDKLRYSTVVVCLPSLLRRDIVTWHLAARDGEDGCLARQSLLST
jgi:hypothetical protein